MDFAGEWHGKLIHPSDIYAKAWDVRVVFSQSGNHVKGTLKAFKDEVFSEAVLEGEVLVGGVQIVTWNIISSRMPGEKSLTMGSAHWCIGYHGVLRIVENQQLYSVLKSYNCQDSEIILARPGKLLSDVKATKFQQKYNPRAKRGQTIAEVTKEMRRMQDEQDATFAWKNKYTYEYNKREREYQAVQKSAPLLGKKHQDLSMEREKIDTMTKKEKVSRPVHVKTDNVSESGLKFVPGAKIVLNNLIFETSKSNLLESSFEQLDEIYIFLLSNPTSTIRLDGHTDRKGDRLKNLELSKARVEAVKTYLTKKGIAKVRILAYGHGDYKLVCEPGCAANRRVEFTIIKD